MIPIHNRSSSRNGFRYDCFFVLVRYVLSYQRKSQAIWLGIFFGYRSGLEEGGLAEGKVKNMPGACFLARGRVHGLQTASGRDVGCYPFA